MSVYISRLTSRQGIDWPPCGQWKEGSELETLETFGKNLDVSEYAHTDLLNSVQTPWARLLLFETALYEPSHPAHQDIKDQWRGLLGVLALHKLLHIGLDAPRRVDLRTLSPASQARNAFLDLRPVHVIAGADVETEKWHQFDLISADGHILGATSPRTLVFTGISHSCPESIPFRTKEGRLTDPVPYYQKFGDELFLGVLAYWLDTLIQRVEHDSKLEDILGTIPTAEGGTVISRHVSFVQALRRWRSKINTPPVQLAADAQSPFEGPYSALRSLQLPNNDDRFNRSDLFVRDRRDVVVCFRREGNSVLATRDGKEINEGGIRIYDGQWIEVTNVLPAQLSVPATVRVIADPATFFEDILIEVELLNPATTFCLEVDGKYYLLPFKKNILEFFNPKEIINNTKVQRVQNQLRVDFMIPLVSNRAIKVSRSYREDDEIIKPEFNASLAFWPDFVCSTGGESYAWSRYFYYKFDKDKDQLDFQPIGSTKPKRTLQDRTWVETVKPLAGFLGTVDGRSGLLLIKYHAIKAPTKYWKVGIDLGSTHTRAFRIEVAKADEGYKHVDGAKIHPIEISPQLQELTRNAPINLRENFFVLAESPTQNGRDEFMSQLVMPQPHNEDHDDWLPREGLVYQHSLLDGFPTNEIRYDFKWNSNHSDYALRAFLRCLLVLLQAQALREGATIVSIAHAHPSVFTSGLVLKHTNEWDGLGNYSQLTIDVPLMESEAVGRYLQVEQGAPVAANVIALDVGGSTTDIALWSENQMNRQESVRMAAGIVGAFAQTENGAFRRELAKIMAGEPLKVRISLDKFEKEDSGFSLMINAALNEAAAKGKLDRLIQGIQNSPEGQKLIAHIMFVFGALLYFVGELGRKAKMQNDAQYHIYFSGKGGQLITWIDNYSQFVREMFAPGILGPQNTSTQAVNNAKVLCNVSKLPKQEVGRGLLADSKLKAENRNSNQEGLITLDPPSVTVGEDGYSNLKWDDELNRSVIASLPRQVPAYNDLKELKNFVTSFVQSTSTKPAAKLLGLTIAEPRNFRDNLKERLFGSARGRILYDLTNYPDDALLEPLFITEVKVLLETVSGNPQLFS
jgi:hypothetical protein